MGELLVVRYIISLIAIILLGYFVFEKDRQPKAFRKKFDKKHVNEESFQNYAKFYGEAVPCDIYFDQKLRKIYECVVRNEMTDIKEIAEKSSCSIAECVLKIKYLKNKRFIGDYYIDTNHFQLLPCSVADQALLDKYKPYIYGSHLQVNEIAGYVANPKHLTIDELRDEVYQELVYLDKKNLLNGLIIDDIDRKIIYYTIEKRKLSNDFETVHCPNCGALNDIDIYGKGRCNYCKTIMKGKEYLEDVL